MVSRAVPALHFVLKVVSRCNLNCTYCYVYNKGDATWRDQPKLMSQPVFDAALAQIREHCVRSRQRLVRLTFHGGEPCLAGPSRFSAWCLQAEKALSGVTTLVLALQTNATLLDDCWIQVLSNHHVQVSVSVDGPQELHDTYRVNHRGEGSYRDVERGIGLLRQGRLPLSILSVIQLGADSLRIHRHLLQLGATSIDYLLPDFTHDTIAPIRAQYGRTPCADYLLPILDWWYKRPLDVKIRIFWNVARLILGGDSELDVLGNQPFRYVFVEPDGGIEGLDVLRVCKGGMAKTGLNVLTDDFTDIAQVSPLHRNAIFDGVPLPTGCQMCPERMTCRGGYLPHRYSSSREFDNPTIWCDDMLRLFSRMRELMQVSVEETALRRQALIELVPPAPRVMEMRL